MSELAGKLNQCYVLSGEVAMTGSTGAKINAIDNSTWNQLCDLLDIPQFGDEYKNRIGGLKDTEVSISGNYDPSDTNGQNVLVAGDICYIGIYPQGTTVAGKQVKAIVGSVEISADVTGKQTISASLSGIGAPAALPARS